MSMPEARELLLEKPLAIIGSEDLVCGFKALGFTVYAVRGQEDAKLALEEVIKQQTAVCLIQDDIYQADSDRIGSRKDLMLPVFIPFAQNAGMSLLERIVKDIRLRATGTN